MPLQNKQPNAAMGGHQWTAVSGVQLCALSLESEHGCRRPSREACMPDRWDSGSAANPMSSQCRGWQQAPMRRGSAAAAADRRRGSDGSADRRRRSGCAAPAQAVQLSLLGGWAARHEAGCCSVAGGLLAWVSTTRPTRRDVAQRPRESAARPERVSDAPCGQRRRLREPRRLAPQHRVQQHVRLAMSRAAAIAAAQLGRTGRARSQRLRDHAAWRVRRGEGGFHGRGGR